ncbi:kinesin-like protein nack2 [Quercus suber]|uniref:Kinesin-like protein n=1 Tax=Quercus suber TaxID=58331 RepID=A0AAW0INY4_QUESU
MIRTSAVTPLTKIRRTLSSTPGGSKFREEKILVTVRMRPLSRKEQALYDLIAWDCVDEHSIVFNNPNHERSATTYTFDKVFSPTCSTQKVYEEGAKDVALSALTGINATIFAYGQTSSGKTYTMRGITENAIKDIYEHIRNHQERDFVVRVSALEIYNETVVDLLNRESGSLRLLDDHETVQSSLRESSGCVKSFIASLNLVDLAGSERASQTNADGTRLKEGSHINRSLLTLTKVIRKLSEGKRSGHIPYRDSKLTRILQSSLGGNARTAIICTMSPALSHVEQTRNTLSFATSAKEVTNNAQVNMVVSDKRLLKDLQKEVARLEAKLQSPESSSSSCLKSLLLEKDLKIQQMEREMEELKRQRDLVEYQLEEERKSRKAQKGLDQSGPSCQVVRCLSFPDEDQSASCKTTPVTRPRNAVGRQAMVRQSVTSTDPSMLVHEIRKLEQRQRQLGEEANRALEVLHKEVSSHRIGSQETGETIAKLLSEIKDMQAISFIPEEIVIGDKTNLMEEITRLKTQGSTIESLEKKLESVQESIDQLVSSFTSSKETPECKTQSKKKKFLPFAVSNNANMQNIIRSPCSPLSTSRKMEYELENKVPENKDALPSIDTLPRPFQATPVKDRPPASQQSNSVNVKKMQRMFKNAAEENIRSIRAYVTELKERVAKLQYQKQLLVCQVLELETVAGTDEPNIIDQSPSKPWKLKFEDERKQIVMLWHLCHVSLIHRTQFFLLFKGDPADEIYMEVELRRLTWLEQHFAELGNASPALLGDEPAGSVSASVKALKQEREYLAKRVSSKLTADEIESLYSKWEIPSGGKQRRLQLVNKLWTNPYDMEHIKESAEIVAKLVGFCESGEQSKEMFELSFANPSDKKSWMGWNLISNLLNL